MRHISSLLSLLFREFPKRLFWAKSLFIGLCFVILSLWLINTHNFFEILFSDYPLLSRFSILWTLFWGSLGTVSKIDLILLSMSGFLFGLNLTIVLRKLNFLRKQGGLKLTLGAGIVSIVATGCASCGLSVVSLIGLGSVVGLLPFRGTELYFLGIIILVVSLFYNLHAYSIACKFLPKK